MIPIAAAAIAVFITFLLAITGGFAIGLHVHHIIEKELQK
jgi:hypothetical protein